MLHRHDLDGDGGTSYAPRRSAAAAAPQLRARVFSPSSDVVSASTSACSSTASSSTSACSCSVCGCACCDLSSIVGSSTSSNTSSSSASGASPFATPSSRASPASVRRRDYAPVARSKCPACLGSGTSVVTGLGCTACYDDATPAKSSTTTATATTSSTPSSTPGSRSSGSVNRGASAAPQQQQQLPSATRTARGDWICHDCCAADLRMKSVYTFKPATATAAAAAASSSSLMTPMRAAPDGADASPSQRILGATPLLRVVVPEKARLTDPRVAATARPHMTVVVPATAAEQQPQIPAVAAQQEQQQPHAQPAATAPAVPVAQPQPAESAAVVAAAPAVTAATIANSKAGGDQQPPAQATQQQQAPPASLLSELYDTLQQFQLQQQQQHAPAGATSAAAGATTSAAQRVLIRDGATQTKAKYFRRRRHDGGTIPPSDSGNDSDRELYARSLAVQADMSTAADDAPPKKQRISVAETDCQTEAEPVRAVRNASSQLDDAVAKSDGLLLVAPAAVVGIDDDDGYQRRCVAVEADFVTPQIKRDLDLRLERLQTEEAEQRARLQDLGYSDLLLGSLHPTARELLLHQRFVRDAGQARLHTLRNAADNAAIQAMCLAECAARQQVECRWTALVHGAIAAPFLQQRQTLQCAALAEQVRSKDAEIAQLRAQLESRAVAAAATEHELRDKLRKALLFGEKVHGGDNGGATARAATAPFTPSISVVDLNLPIEVRFARAHAIAAKAVDLERGGPGLVSAQEAGELSEAHQQFRL